MKIKPNITKRGAIISLSVILGGLIVDFFSKLAVMSNMHIGQSIPLIKNVLHLKFVINYGAAFGSFANQRWVFMLMSILLIIGLVLLLVFWKGGNSLFYTSVSMILAGGMGNMVDRVFYGYVVDFIDFCAFPSLWRWVFNGADSFVCVGAGLLVLWYILEEIRSAKSAKGAVKKKPLAEAGGANESDEESNGGCK